MIRTAPHPRPSDWLTVDEISQELKLSKSIVYRLIRNGELEAVNLVVSDEEVTAKKGHYRIRRSALNQYLEAKKVKPPPQPVRSSGPFPAVPKGQEPPRIISFRTTAPVAEELQPNYNQEVQYP